MKKIYLLFFLFFILHSAFGQGGTWTWISGDSAVNSLGVFGTQGIPSVNNHPPGLYEACEWKDKKGNFWVGIGTNSTGAYCDLWKYNPPTNEWTWVKGNGLTGQAPVYGTKGIASVSNSPGALNFGTASWVDTAGNLWMFGGLNSTYQSMNDLWEYDITTNNWTWMNGNGIPNSRGIHGVQGIPSASNVPGGRNETCAAWTDSLNNLWLFGGKGYDDNGAFGYLDDLCKYNIAANEWTWMKGSALANISPNYGTKGVSSINNNPGGRWPFTKWKDLKGNFWVMGGYILGDKDINDIWKYDVSINEWTWMYGPQITNDTGRYQHTCTINTLNMPYSRMEQRSAVTDNCGRFWLFGGAFYDTKSQYYDALNDLWIFDPQQLKWEWLSGNIVFNQAGNYGALGVTLPSNSPPSSAGALAWWGNDNKFYLYGGGNGAADGFSGVWVFNPDTSCIPSCNNVSVLPPVSAFQSNKTNICANECVNFTDKSTNAASYHWIFPGGSPPSSTDQNPQVCYLDSGIYNVTLIASNSAGSDTLTIYNYITVNPAPPTPNIQDHPGIAKDTLICSSNPAYIFYQWYKDSTLINGATDTILVANQNGNYNVEVTGTNGCKIGVGINLILGLQNYMSDHVISLWPNPVGDKFTVYGLRFTVSQIDIYNVLGEKAHSRLLMTEGQLPITIDISTLAKGVYLIQLSADDKVYRARVVKE